MAYNSGIILATIVTYHSQNYVSILGASLLSPGPGLDLYAHNLGEDNSTDIG